MAAIPLHPPVRGLAPRTDSAVAADDRLRPFPHRALGSGEFDRLDRYAQARLAPLLASRPPGIVDGLRLKPSRIVGGAADGSDVLALSTGVAITAGGLALRLTEPLSFTWTELLAERARAHRAAHETEDAPPPLEDGLYLLHLAMRVRTSGDAAGPSDPCLIGRADMRRDERRDTLVSARLGRRLGELAADDAAALDRAIGRLLADLDVERGFAPLDPATTSVDGEGRDREAVPLALVAVRAERIVRLSEAAGRWFAAAAAPSRMLAAFVGETIADAVARDPDLRLRPAARTTDAERAADIALLAPALARLRNRLAALPPSGPLPVNALIDASTPQAFSPLLPASVDLVFAAAPRSAVAAARRAADELPPIRLDAARPADMALVLAVADSDWSPDLLDVPEIDPRLVDELVDAYGLAFGGRGRERNAHAALHASAPGAANSAPAALEGFDMLLTLAAAADPAARARQLFVRRAGETPANSPDDDLLIAVLESLAEFDSHEALRAERGQDPTPRGAAAIAADLAARGYRVPPPAPIDPATPETVAAREEVAAVLSREVAAGLPERAQAERIENAPTEQPVAIGAVARRVLAAELLPLVERRASHHRGETSRFNDLAKLNRQHFDQLTASMSTLASGAPLDGSGLRFTRRLFDFNVGAPPAAPAAPPPPPPPQTGGAALNANFTTRFSAFREQPASLRTAALAADQPRFTTGAVELNQPASSNLAVGLRADAISSAFDQSAILSASAGTLSDQPRYTVQAAAIGTISHASGGPTVQAATSAVSQGLHTFMVAQMGVRWTDRFAGAVAPAQAATDHDALQNLVNIGRRFSEQGIFLESESLAHERRQERLISLAGRLRRAMDELDGEIRAARGALAAASRTANEAEGDYLQAQHLLVEEARAVAAARARRRRILDNPLGLFFVRRRGTTMAAPLVEPLPLRFLAPDDVLPGWTEAAALPFPADLRPFLEALGDLPIGDFAALRDLRSRLALDAAVLDIQDALRRRLLETRREALTVHRARAQQAETGKRLTRMLAEQEVSHAALAQLEFAGGTALEQLQRRASKVVSLAAVLASPGDPIHGRAAALQRDLEIAAKYLVDALGGLPASLRFACAQAAEDDVLPIATPRRWPMMDRPDESTYSAIRSVDDVVRWLRARISDKAGAEAAPTMARYIRAAVIVAAHGDPDEIIEGRVAAAPPRLFPGGILRLDLPRVPRIGLAMMLLDADRRVVGRLEIEDVDTAGATARVVELGDTPPATLVGLAAASFRAAKRRS